MIKIALATEKDIQTLIKLNNEVQKYHIQLAPDKYKNTDNEELFNFFSELINSPNVQTLILYKNSYPIGYTVLKIIQKEESAFKYPQQFLEVDQIGISQEHRSQGYGKMLISKIKEYAESISIKTIQLTVFAKNTSAIKAYENLGFNPEIIRMEFNL